MHIKTEENKKAFITHYLHNKKYPKVSSYYKELALNGIKDSPSEMLAQYNLFNENIPFPPVEKPKFTFIDLFAGIGGMRIAFQNAMGRCVYTSEWDDYCKRTYYENFGEYPFGDIRVIDAENIPDFDILVAGFPCQAFSIAGRQQGFQDTRGTLFFDIARIIKAKKPKAFLLENVKNLFSHDQGKTLQVIKNTLVNDLGYSFIPFILNSMVYGNIPQSRERIYMVGYKGEAKFSKSVKNNKKSLTSEFEMPSAIELTKSIHDILDQGKQADRYYYGKNSKYYPMLNEEMTNADTVYQWRRVYLRENKSNVCPTLTANMGTGGHNVPLIKDDFGIRKLTPKECVKFQGFPKNFRFPKGLADSHCYKQAGNSVVVPVVERIAREIARVLELN